MLQERKTLDELSTSQSNEFFRLESGEAAALHEAGGIIAAAADDIAEQLFQQVRALPGAPRLIIEEKRFARVRKSFRRWLLRVIRPWHRTYSESAVRRLAACYARAGVPATYISATFSCVETLCLQALMVKSLTMDAPAEFMNAIIAFHKRLAMERLGILGWHFRHLRDSLRAQKNALEAMVVNRSATLRSTVAFSQAIADEIDETQVVRALAEHVIRMIHPESLVIHIIEPGDLVEPKIAVSKGKIVSAPDTPCAQALRGDWQLCRAARTGRCFHVGDVNNALINCPHQEVNQREGSYCCIPLAGGIKVHGWMHLTRNTINCFTDEELEVLSIYGQMVGTAITSLRLVQENRHQAATDPLTGQYNRRHFQAMLAKENLLLQRRSGTSSILMLDVDRFKDFNDRYGHDTGDRILMTLSNTIRDCVRATDEVARLGGDEFVMLLRDCDAEHSMQLAQRICRAVAASSVRVDATTSVALNVSIGLACCPDHARTLENTMLLADTALLRAKENGGAQAVLFDPAADGDSLANRSRHLLSTIG